MAISFVPMSNTFSRETPKDIDAVSIFVASSPATLLTTRAFNRVLIVLRAFRVIFSDYEAMKNITYFTDNRIRLSYIVSFRHFCFLYYVFFLSVFPHFYSLRDVPFLPYFFINTKSPRFPPVRFPRSPRHMWVQFIAVSRPGCRGQSSETHIPFKGFCQIS